MVVRCGRARLRRSGEATSVSDGPQPRKRWLTSLKRAQQRVPEAVAVATIAEGEADIFDLFALPRREVS